MALNVVTSVLTVKSDVVSAQMALNVVTSVLTVKRGVVSAQMALNVVTSVLTVKRGVVSAQMVCRGVADAVQLYLALYKCTFLRMSSCDSLCAVLEIDGGLSAGWNLSSVCVMTDVVTFAALL